jgi:hypothetical protein
MAYGQKYGFGKGCHRNGFNTLKTINILFRNEQEGVNDIHIGRYLQIQTFFKEKITITCL